MKIVCFSEIQWRYVRTRKQQILSRFPGDWDILFLSSVVAGKKNNFRPMKDGRITHLCIPVFKNFPQKSLKTLFSFPPARFMWNLILLVWVRIALAVTGFAGRDRVFYVSNIYYSAIIPFLPRKMMLYDCNDDPMEFPDAPEWSRKYFRKLVSMADRTVAVSRGLMQRLSELGVRDIHYIGNGVDYDLFRKAIESGVPEEMKGLKRPLIGYSGAIAPWFDMKTLDLVAASFKDASIVLFGPLFEPGRGELEDIIRKRGNIHYLGSFPYEMLGAYIAALDVAIIPLQMNELMRMADPNKLYEYAAAERPIVTFKFAKEMEDLSGFVYLAETAEEFVEGVRTALDKGGNSKSLREFAVKSSWQARADEMVALVMDYN
ncbi:MAG: glycosyltransferase [Candidatus Krumholzibacteriota bacterium]|nr:glycosyltransferase [Candidatus Krumholzibacteriota bacterium]